MQRIWQRISRSFTPAKPVCLPANGRSSTEVELTMPAGSPGEVELSLRGAGSYAPDGTVCQTSVPVLDGRVVVRVYAPSRPGTGTITGPGIKQRVLYTACTAWQALCFDWVPTLVWALAIALFLRGYAFANTYVLSVSMQPTLYENDLMLLDKLSYRVLGHDPQRGDIFVLHPASEIHDLVKRVVGLPGETLLIRDGQVFIDGAPLSEPYVREPAGRDFGPVKIPAGQYFVMGDNRNHSSDSRAFGPVPRESLRGRAVVLYWPPSHAKVLTPSASP